MKNWSPVPLAICEVCSLIWALAILGGTVYLTEWRGWVMGTWVIALLLAISWTCKYCRVPKDKE
jgi:hypothetical protein